MVMDEDLEYVQASILQADDIELSEIIQSVIRRYGVLHPDWEVMFLSLPRDDPHARHRCVEETIAFLRQNM